MLLHLWLYDGQERINTVLGLLPTTQPVKEGQWEDTVWQQDGSRGQGAKLWKQHSNIMHRMYLVTLQIEQCILEPHKKHFTSSQF